MTSTDALALQLSGYVPVYVVQFIPKPGRFHPRIGRTDRVFPTQTEAHDYEIGVRAYWQSLGLHTMSTPATHLGWADAQDDARRNQRSI